VSSHQVTATTVIAAAPSAAIPYPNPAQAGRSTVIQAANR
jgi:hypothetical protein